MPRTERYRGLPVVLRVCKARLYRQFSEPGPRVSGPDLLTPDHWNILPSLALPLGSSFRGSLEYRPREKYSNRL